MTTIRYLLPTLAGLALAGIDAAPLAAQSHVGLRSALLLTAPSTHRANLGFFVTAGMRRREESRGRYTGFAVDVGGTVWPSGWSATSGAVRLTHQLGPKSEAIYLLLTGGYAVDRVTLKGAPAATVHNVMFGYGFGGRLSERYNLELEMRLAGPNAVVGDADVFQISVNLVRVFR